MKFIIILVIIIGHNLFSQDKVEPLKVQQSQNEHASSIESVLKTEEKLDKEILEINNKLKGHYSLLFMRLDTIPKHTIVTRGIAKGDECIENPNRSETGNCLKLEQYDFIDGGNKDNKGPQSKQIILFYDIAPNTLASAGKPADAKLTKIKTKILIDNFKLHQKTNLEVIDTEPLGKPSHDDKIFVNMQKNDYPMMKDHQFDVKIGIGKLRLDTFDNSDPEPIRMTFKQQSYLKSLIVFEGVLRKIFDSNDLSANNRIKTGNQFLNSSLK